jgi:DUF917 family protein
VSTHGGGYAGGIGSITAEDVVALYEGATFYSPAVGHANRSSLISWLTGLLDRNGPVPLLRPQAVAPLTRCVSVCVIGSGSAMADLPPSGDEFAEAVRRIEELQREPFEAVYPLDAATISALAPVAAASQLGVPLLDTDGMGRVYPLIHQTSMYLAGLSPTPMVAQGATGESVLIEVPDGSRADRLVRGAVEVMGGWAALASYPTTAGALGTAGLQGTVSRLIEVGRLMLKRNHPDVLVQRLAAITGSRRLGGGRITELEHLTRPTDVTIPAHPSSLVIQEIADRRRQLRVELRSDIVAVFGDGLLVAAAPDLICLVDHSSGELAALDSLEPGDSVDILVTPADAIWHSHDGMAMVGLHSHDIPLEHPARRA